jgi:hypothetical protein
LLTATGTEMFAIKNKIRPTRSAAPALSASVQKT